MTTIHSTDTELDSWLSSHVGATEEHEHAKWRDCCRQMFSNDWCPSHIKRLARDHYLEHFQLLANAHPLNPNLDHTTCQQSSNCVAFARLTGGSTPKHVDAGCRCSSVSIDYAELISILKSGSLVVIDLIETGPSDIENAPTLSVKVRRRTHRDEYVAVSHVWSDGLGNESGNSIPYCQLSRLNRSIRQLIPGRRSGQERTVVGWFASSIRRQL